MKDLRPIHRPTTGFIIPGGAGWIAFGIYPGPIPWIPGSWGSIRPGPAHSITFPGP